MFEHMHWNIIISFSTLSLNAKAGFVLQTTIVLLSVFFFFFQYISFHEGLASIHRFINKSLPCKQMCFKIERSIKRDRRPVTEVLFTRTRFRINSLLVQHCKKHNHEFDLDNVKIIDCCSQWSKRLFLEAWHSIREPNAINEHIYIPDIYKALGNPKWRFCGSFKHSFAFVSHFIAEEGYSILTETFDLLRFNRPFSKMAAKNLNKSKLKTNTSARKSAITLVTLPSFSISGEISAEKMYVENWKIYRRLYDWG